MNGTSNGYINLPLWQNYSPIFQKLNTWQYLLLSIAVILMFPDALYDVQYAKLKYSMLS